MIDKKLLPCPFCGEEPEFDNYGTFISIDCCVSMDLQKSDHLSIEERGEWIEKEYKYRNDLEEKVKNILIDKWNTRNRNDR